MAVLRDDIQNYQSRTPLREEADAGQYTRIAHPRGALTLEDGTRLSVEALLSGKARTLRGGGAGGEVKTGWASPSAYRLYKSGPEDKDSQSTIETRNYPYYGSDFSLSMSLKDKVRLWSPLKFDVDTFEAYFLQEYEVPASTSPSTIYWHIMASLGLIDIIATVDLADFAHIWVYPVAFSSPEGIEPTWSQLEKATLTTHPSVINVHVYDDKRVVHSAGSGDFFNFEYSYPVAAGQQSKIYFGVRATLWVGDGRASVSVGMNVNSISPAPPRREGLLYVIWPDEVSLNCYISSAICHALGKGDDCHELDVLRKFRDDHLSRTDRGRELVSRYYRTAPRILEGIRRRPDREQILTGLYDLFLKDCVQCLENGASDQALDLYVKMVAHVEALSPLDDQERSQVL